MDRKYFELALKNITRYGDTDIFPYPVENIIFEEFHDKTIDLLSIVDSSFEDFLVRVPPINITTCAPVGYTGFRWATQIDPIWNAYLLALVLSLAEKIEQERVPETTTYSYRFGPDYDKGSLFKTSISWRNFQADSIANADKSGIEYVVLCDISDFYTRVYHHRLENALQRIDEPKVTSKKIMGLLQKFSGTNSYGIPIGCPASRILAELLLNGIDRILLSNGKKFTRYVDDYHFFCRSMEEAHSTLTFFSQKLMKNEGLTLQKNKTQILTAKEFVHLVNSKLRAESEDEGSEKKAKFLSLAITYDPYSPTADDDYKRIREDLREFDVVGMLNDEIRKTKINSPFAKHLIKSFTVADQNVVSNAFIVISENLASLYPIFSTVMYVANANLERLTEDSKSTVLSNLRELVNKDSFIIQSDLHVAFLAKVLGKVQSYENEESLVKLYERNKDSILVRSIIMQIMTKWKSYHWLSDQKPNFQTMNRWERRIFIIASYILGEEGRHWRDHMVRQFSEFEMLYRDWAAKRKNENKLEAAL